MRECLLGKLRIEPLSSGNVHPYFVTWSSLGEENPNSALKPVALCLSITRLCRVVGCFALCFNGLAGQGSSPDTTAAGREKVARAGPPSGEAGRVVESEKPLISTWFVLRCSPFSWFILKEGGSSNKSHFSLFQLPSPFFLSIKSCCQF